MQERRQAGGNEHRVLVDGEVGRIITLGDVVDGQTHDPCDGDAEQGSQRACGPDVDGQSGVGKAAPKLLAVFVIAEQPVWRLLE
jgi:hypothetical protein